jgi:hypothetical protein
MLAFERGGAWSTESCRPTPRLWTEQLTGKGNIIMAKATYFRSLVVLCALAAVVPACGGGGSGGSGGKAAPIATGLPLNTPPSAPFVASQTSAASLAAEIQDGAEQLVAAAAAPSNLPGSTGGVEETLQCSQVSPGGSGTITLDDTFSGSVPAAGDAIEISYNDCTIMEDGISESLNGSLEEEYVSYTDATDFEFAITATNLTESVDGTTETFNFSETLTVAAGVTTISYTASNGGSLEITASDVVTSGNDVTITSATYIYPSAAGGGVVSAVYDNWEYDTTTGLPISGSVTLTGAGGATVVVEASATGYTVTYTSSVGVTSSYTVAY